MRGFLEISQKKLPKRAFRARLPTIFTEKASKTIVSCDASSKFHRTSFQNERFARCFRQFSQKKLPKRSFRAMRPRNFTEQAAKKIVSCEASSNFQRTSFQNERFARCLRQFSQKKFPIIVSCDASSKFNRTSFQNERFMRCFRQFSQKKLPKRSFRARLPRNFTEQASKTNVSCEASLQISYNKASKTNVSRDASDNFHRKFAFRHSFVPSTHRVLREGSSSKSKMCASLQRRVIPHFKIHVLLQRRTQKCMNQAQDARGN